ncbi:dihydroorotate dehydrogenase [bacterium]|nr:dihydroorotate dehydrogenase [bacterium]
MNLKTKLNKLVFQNPITTASGTFGSEMEEYVNFNKLGAIVTKTITKERKAGNPSPRLYETEWGLLNSIGLQNPGVESFITETIPLYEKYQTPLIVSFSASTQEEFMEVLSRLESVNSISGYEVNVSCPNVENEGLAFGVDAQVVNELTAKLRKLTKKELIIKLTPNVTNIVDIAIAAKEGGADSLALINTLLGMAIDPMTGKSRIMKKICGYSGSAIKPVALANVYRVAQAIDIPILAMGGAENYLDVLEFIYAGASMVAIGTANFYNPAITEKIISDLSQHFSKYNLTMDKIRGKSF